ncbi:MAG: hypothetical protein NDI93_09445 [Pseudomonas sp.]|nr:hypothetical protein [Pseudomonas sp.]
MNEGHDWHNDPWDDAPEHIRSRLQDRGRAARRRVAGITGALALLATGFALLSEFNFDTAPPAREAQTSAARSAPPARPFPPSPEHKPARAAVPPSPATAQPQNLDSCLGDDNTLDNRVARCRFGNTISTAPAAKPLGMVSAEYLARYRAERDSRPARTHTVTIERTGQWVERGDGKSYLATWDVRNNRIDYGSVCGNHRQGSIEYRECRKAAKQWYRTECRRWEKRRENDGQDSSQRMQERYCSAANGFSPMG